MTSQWTGAEGTFEESHGQTQTTTLTCSAEWNPETHLPEICAGHTTSYSSGSQYPEFTGNTDLPGRRFGIAPEVLYQLPKGLALAACPT